VVQSGAWRVDAETGCATPMFAAAKKATATSANKVKRRRLRFM
jgi:hypothetical protein